VKAGRRRAKTSVGKDQKIAIEDQKRLEGAWEGGKSFMRPSACNRFASSRVGKEKSGSRLNWGKMTSTFHKLEPS